MRIAIVAAIDVDGDFSAAHEASPPMSENPYASSTLTPEESLLPMTEAEGRLLLDRLATRLAMAALLPPFAPLVVLGMLEDSRPSFPIGLGIMALATWDGICTLPIWFATDSIIRQRRLAASRMALWSVFVPGLRTLVLLPLAWPLLKRLRDPRLVGLFRN
jgi:hypothetical protein